MANIFQRAAKSAWRSLTDKPTVRRVPAACALGWTARVAEDEVVDLYDASGTFRARIPYTSISETLHDSDDLYLELLKRYSFTVDTPQGPLTGVNGTDRGPKQQASDARIDYLGRGYQLVHPERPTALLLRNGMSIAKLGQGTGPGKSPMPRVDVLARLDAVDELVVVVAQRGLPWRKDGHIGGLGSLPSCLRSLSCHRGGPWPQRASAAFVRENFRGGAALAPLRRATGGYDAGRSLRVSPRTQDFHSAAINGRSTPRRTQT